MRRVGPLAWPLVMGLLSIFLLGPLVLVAVF